MNEQEIKDLINEIDTKLYVLNEVFFQHLCDIKELYNKLKMQFVPEQFTETKVTMRELHDAIDTAFLRGYEMGFEKENYTIDNIVTQMCQSYCVPPKITELFKDETQGKDTPL